MATRESIESRDKYEDTMEFFFADRIKNMNGNHEALPRIKSPNGSVEGDALSGAIGRRALCNSRKETFVRDFDEKGGMFLRINRGSSECSLPDTYTRYLMCAKILLPLFRRHGRVGIYTWFGDMGIEGRTFPPAESDMVASTTRLSHRLIGCEKGIYANQRGKRYRGRATRSERYPPPIRGRIANVVTSKNLSGAARHWDLERTPIDEIHSTKRCKPGVLAQQIRETSTTATFLIKGREFNTHRGGIAI